MRAGERELAVRHDLGTLPESMRKGGLAANALMLARLLDHGVCWVREEDGKHIIQSVPARDIPVFAREIRQSIIALQDQAPGEVKGDETDEVKARREKRLTAGGS